ncbi:MAG: hypothetical protein MK137_08735, partial [Rickettsiales bacterium]|nr:hypothetical protein [Rickettsiales bacterium]
VLLAIKIFLLVWGIFGFLEYYNPSLEFGLQNAPFPKGVQFLHWFLLVITGASFTLGFLLRWKYTPFMTVIMYAMLATLCFIETVDFEAFGGGAMRFVIMAGEYVVYVLISMYLMQSQKVKERFG